MIKCTSCGNMMNDAANFCNCCGYKVQRMEYTSRQKIYEGNIHLCPACGGRVESFAAFCSLCGYEFRDSKSSKAVSEFADFIIQWEAKPILLGDNINDRDRIRLTRVKQIEVANQISNYIRTYSVPNTKEDMLEFLFLASSNINEQALYPHERERASAWFAKVEQVYFKAKTAFYADSNFAMFEQVYKEAKTKYQKAMNALELRRKRKTRKVLMIIGLSVAGFILFEVFCLVIVPLMLG